MHCDLVSNSGRRTEIASVIKGAVDVIAASYKSGDQRHDFHAGDFGPKQLRLSKSIARISVIYPDLNPPRNKPQSDIQLCRAMPAFRSGREKGGFKSTLWPSGRWAGSGCVRLWPKRTSTLRIPSPSFSPA